MKKMTRQEVYTNIRNDRYVELMLEKTKHLKEELDAQVRIYHNIDGFSEMLIARSDKAMREANIYAVQNTERLYRAFF